MEYLEYVKDFVRDKWRKDFNIFFNDSECSIDEYYRADFLEECFIEDDFENFFKIHRCPTAKEYHFLLSLIAEDFDKFSMSLNDTVVYLKSKIF